MSYIKDTSSKHRIHIFATEWAVLFRDAIGDKYYKKSRNYKG